MKYTFQPYSEDEILSGHINMGGSNPKGETIELNSRYIKRGGRPWLGVMGEYHFNRDHAENWHTELSKMKAGGIDVVPTYLFWIYHEEEEGKMDFSGDLDIRKFVLTAKAVGLDVILRIGPWAHGECRNGGFPDWLMNKGYKLRTNDPDYLSYVKKWYTDIYNEISDLFYKDGGNIIGVQIENELTDQPEHMKTLLDMAKEIGYDVPVYTMTGWNSKFGAKLPVDEALPVFAAYCDAPWDSSLEELPLSSHYSFNTTRNDTAVGADLIQETDDDGWRLPYERYPFATCELGPGLMPTHHRRIVVSPMDAYAMSLVKLGCGNNLIGYYMYHGGTNKIGKLSTFQESKATGYPNDYPILNYDFHTALTQYGEAREQYGLLNMLHLFAHAFGSELANMTHVPAEQFVNQNNLKDLRYAMRTDGKSGFVFINHYQRLRKLEDVENVEITAFDVTFPTFDVKGDVSFFMPFHMPIGTNDLIYGTAQPLTVIQNAFGAKTYFFAEIPGISAVYYAKNSSGETKVFEPESGEVISFKDGTRIVTLSWNDAKYLRKLDGQVYVGEGVNLYEEHGVIYAIEEGSFAYRKWNGHSCEHISVEKHTNPGEFSIEDVEAAFDLPYPEELTIGGPRHITWKKLSVTSDFGFVEINETYDAAQIYKNGQLVADNYYTNEVWRVPASLIYGGESYLVMSELKDDCYIELT